MYLKSVETFDFKKEKNISTREEAQPPSQTPPHADRLQLTVMKISYSTPWAQTMYALRLLRSQGLNGPNLWEVTRATLVSRLTYASQAWCGMITEGGKNECPYFMTAPTAPPPTDNTLATAPPHSRRSTALLRSTAPYDSTVLS